jgi:hypothetical protein
MLFTKFVCVTCIHAFRTDKFDKASKRYSPETLDGGVFYLVIFVSLEYIYGFHIKTFEDKS